MELSNLLIVLVSVASLLVVAFLISRFGFGSRLLSRNRKLRHAMDTEIQTHLSLREEELVRAGVPAAEAHAEALARFGDLRSARRRLYASARRARGRMSWSLWIEALGSDARLGIRQAFESPSFSALSIATFALGIGLTTAVFTIIDHSMLRPLPFPEPERLVALDSVSANGDAFPYVSMANWVDWKEGSRTLESSALYDEQRVSVATATESQRVAGTVVTGPFFDVLGTTFILGRGFTEQEAQSGEPRAVVSEGFWERALGGSTVLGEIVLAGVPTRVVGVVAAEQAFPQGIDVWLPGAYRRGSGRLRNNINWLAVARLRPETTIAEAHADLDGIARMILETDPEGIYSHGVGVEELRVRVVGDSRGTLALLMSAVVSVLLVARLRQPRWTVVRAQLG